MVMSPIEVFISAVYEAFSSMAMAGACDHVLAPPDALVSAAVEVESEA